MKRYLVGGAVRDQLLGRPVKDRDWLVTGATPEMLIAQGYQQVGQDFPVFLDPTHHEEHALPRGDTTLPEPEQVIQDLIHRDLTINALALDENGQLIDPLNGAEDLQQRILRHTPAFFDDPIRILRLARFAARYSDLGFTIAPETIPATQEQIAQGILNQQVAERCWSEIQRALAADKPSRFFLALHELTALQAVMPELAQLFGVPQPTQHHPEIDTGLHSMLVVDRASELSDDPVVRFAALTHDLGKGTTPKEELPRHIAHERRGVKLVKTLCKRLKAPSDYRELATLTCEYHTHGHKLNELKPATVLKLLNALDCFRRPERLAGFLIVCQADAQGRTGFEKKPYPQATQLKKMFEAARSIDTAILVSDNKGDGRAIQRAIHRARIDAIASLKPVRSRLPDP